MRSVRILAVATLVGLASVSTGLAQGLPSDVEQRLGVGRNRGVPSDLEQRGYRRGGPLPSDVEQQLRQRDYRDRRSRYEDDWDRPRRWRRPVYRYGYDNH